MATVHEKIQVAFARNAELVSTLRETDHAEPDLENHNRYIADLDRQLQESVRRTDQLGRARAKELKDHERYRDSVMRRFIFKAAGQGDKFARRAEREEREYFEALQESHRESEARAGLEAMLRDAHAARSGLEDAARRHRSAQAELDGLYDDIFRGPTPGFPEEDAREREAHEALQAYHDTRVRAEGEAHAGRMLAEAQARARDAAAQMERALTASRHDIFGGGSWADAMERNALHRADVLAREARTLALNARLASPLVDAGSLPPVNVAHGSILSDVLFDNIFTDLQFHNKIKASRLEVQRLRAAVDGLAADCNARRARLAADLEEKEVLLESTRLALQETRQRVFQRYSDDNDTAALPAPPTPPKDAPPPFTP
ncbi:hypothetical protein GGTG_05719 [Gaeumannomyces tritici R3-111a-1]|uniref:Uncharacterized protein n=1 Tax=Gaeumannomyces tritici (strain R3-111a-1) TaxID=644352 RepID=J3NWQ7_GAET3|nr:hypothetical protein GGTG_05719 [Gaeumannomyces tritici R3-111a-1]EJT75789.1 hypothetical protein GGTG_05719 [Gaeumannomyces tritici R3-111a-1]